MLNIATSANCEKILYDIYPIKMVGQAGKSATSSPNQTIPQKQSGVNGKHSVGRGFDEMAGEACSVFLLFLCIEILLFKLFGTI